MGENRTDDFERAFAVVDLPLALAAYREQPTVVMEAEAWALTVRLTETVFQRLRQAGNASEEAIAWWRERERDQHLGARDDVGLQERGEWLRQAQDNLAMGFLRVDCAVAVLPDIDKDAKLRPGLPLWAFYVTFAGAGFLFLCSCGICCRCCVKRCRRQREELQLSAALREGDGLRL